MAATMTGGEKQVIFDTTDQPESPAPSAGSDSIRIIFSIHSVEHPHVLPRTQLLTSKFFTKKFRGNDGKPLSDLSFVFNRRDVSPMWHYWVLNREVVYNFFSPEYGQMMERLSEDQRTRNHYLNLLACLCLSRILEDRTFENAVMDTLVIMMRDDSNRVILISCLNEVVMRDLFSFFDKTSPVRPLIINTMVDFGTAGDIIRLINGNGFPREYVTAFVLRAFEETSHLRSIAEAAKPVVVPEVEEEPAQWERMMSHLRPQAARFSSKFGE